MKAIIKELDTISIKLEAIKRTKSEMLRRDLIKSVQADLKAVRTYAYLKSHNKEENDGNNLRD